MRRTWLPAGALAAAVATSSAVWADGFVAAGPYNYLHPPRGQAKHNHRPTLGHTKVHLHKGRTSLEFLLFTKDGQAGMEASPGGLGAQAPATSLSVSIAPVNTPPHLPSKYLADGNAYRFGAQGLPGKRPMVAHQSFAIILRWPHAPNAVYAYRRHHWKKLCGFGNWILSVSTVACRTSTLGTFQAVRIPTKPQAHR